MSAPAAKAFSLPVMTTQPMVSSASNSSSTWPSSRTSGVHSALSAFGRFNLTTPTAPFRSTRMLSYAMVRLRRRWPRRSLHVEDDRLLMGEMLEHRLERGLLAEAGILDAAIGEIGLDDEVLVDLDEAGLEPVRRVERGLEVARPDRRGEAVFAVIGGGDRLLVVAELDDASDGPE